MHTGHLMITCFVLNTLVNRMYGEYSWERGRCEHFTEV